MASEAALRRDAFRIAEALRRYAEQKGRGPESFLIFMKVNTAWNTFDVGIVSDRFRKDKKYGRVDDRRHIELLDFLRDELKDEPGLFPSLSLYLSAKDDPNAFPAFAVPKLDSDEIEIDIQDLNPGVPDPRRAFLRGSLQSGT